MDGQDDPEVEEPDQRLPPDPIEEIRREPSAPVGDITFAVAPGGFEILYSDRLAHEYQELVDQSADWLENVMGAVNLGQIDHEILLADGVLTDEIRNGLIAWWMQRVEDLDLR